MTVLPCLFFLFADPGLKKFILPVDYLQPKVTWSDFNRDGIQDFWIREANQDLPEKGELWLHDGRWQQDRFLKLEYALMAGQIEPRGEGDRYWVQCYFKGILYVFAENQWKLEQDLQAEYPIRPGMNPISLENLLLLPTYQGYQLLDENCPIATFEAHPTLSVSKSKFQLTWPLPQERDLNGDGLLDLVAAPIHAPQQGEAWVWYALQKGDGWHERTVKIKFPATQAIHGFQYGDLDGDGFPELVVLTLPTNNLSVFDELGFYVYSGTADSGWDPVALQSLKTNQNIWQTGPIEMDQKGIRFFYYKGLIHSRFRMDQHAWDPKGFVKPESNSVTWKMEMGNREQIILDYDFNGDDQQDLLLIDKKGLSLYYRGQGKLLFSEKADQLVAFSGVFSPNEGRAKRSLKGRLSGRDHATLILEPKSKKPQFWSLHLDQDQAWLLEQLPL